METRSFQKLKGTASGVFKRSSTYYNDEVILFVDTGLSSERYRRIAYTDICGLTMSESNRMALFNALFSIAALIFGVIALAQEFQVPMIWILASIFVVLIIPNSIKGKGCKCVITTRYSTVPVASIKRMKQARKLKSFIDSRVSSFGELLSPEKVQELYAKKNERPAPAPVPQEPEAGDEPIVGEKLPEATVSPPVLPDPPEQTNAAPLAPPAPSLGARPPPIQFGRPTRRHFAYPIAAGLLALSSLVSGVFPSFPPMLTIVFLAGAVIAAIFAAAKNIQSEAGANLKTRLTWAMAYHFLSLIVSYFVWIYTNVSATRYYQNGVMIEPEMTGNSAMSIIFLANAAITSLLALWVLQSIRRCQPKQSSDA